MDVKKLWQGAKQVLVAILSGLIVLFAFVNLEAVPVKLLFTEVQVSLSLLVLISALGGVSIGWMGGALRGRRKRKALQAGGQAELPVSAEDEAWLSESVEEEVAAPLE
jgi:uncharacterized integral membrane protein